MPDTTDHITTTTLPDLIDREAIRRADADRDATLAAHRDAEAALAEAEKALRAASRTADAAAATGASVEAEQAVIDAELTLRACQRRAKATAAAAAAAAAAEAPRVHRAAVGQAHRHAIFAAVERRISACRAAEDADRARKKAESDFAEATKDLLGFVNLGTPLPGGLDAPRHLQPEKTELQYWTAHQVDIESRLFHPGEKT
jgi:choline dehydrogenase-like flavoprotein